MYTNIITQPLFRDKGVLKQPIERNIVLSVVAGVLLALSMPRPGWWPLAWVGLVPLLIAVSGSRPRQALLYGWIAGAVYYGVILYWLTVFGSLPWVALVAKEAIYIGAFAAGASFLGPLRRGRIGYVAVPALWVTMQYARAFEPFSFTWGSLAHTQAVNTGLTQVASVAGPWGVDFVIVLGSLALSVLIASRGSRTARNVTAATYALCVALSVAGQMIPERLSAVSGFATHQTSQHSASRNPETSQGIDVALIQGNLDQNAKSDDSYNLTAFREYASTSIDAAYRGASLIVWPETSLTASLSGTEWGNLVSQLAESTRRTYIVGAYDSTDPSDLTRLSNSAFLYDPLGRTLGVYRKVRLVPYGEFVPLRKRMPWLSRYGIREYDVVPGKSFEPIETGFGPVGVSICFESLFPGIARGQTRDGAQLLAIITNDGWFLRTQAARHHLMMAQLRAVENRRYVLRGAATGISAIIDPYGRICGEMDIFTKGIVYGRVYPRRDITPYTRFGDWLAYLCIAAVAISVGSVVRRRKIGPEVVG